MAVENDVARQLTEIARQLHSEGDVAHMLTRTVDLAVATVEGGDHAGISLVTQGHSKGQVPDERSDC